MENMKGEYKSPFKGLKDKIYEMKIGTDVIKAKPIVSDVEAFITMKKEMTDEDAKKISNILVNIIARANPDEEREDIESYVATHYGDVMTQASIAFGFATPEQVTEAKKKLKEEI